MTSDVPRHSSGAVAAAVGLERWRLLYLIERRVVPGPSLVVAGRRLFSDDDVDRIRRCLEARPELSGACKTDETADKDRE
jgi:hypothetical protein